ncbi:hypothetical protein GON01_03450 [Sphingomonas sp. MAH-20]|uniref:KfrA N-terminal DNA-binding domain-containing protein n=1 Tax=Sphingomonas horti TaxID=2682842 RepID=A0A6I4IYM0_9SPHN|nr:MULTISPECIES: DNA-binding protein [Sphingomonas]MBA2921049.1 DNA-binding protein [Sphingomonas sp. CGMCC 1.13658]MVO76993.1 hypothetical protein [Sphingomonas horti]
MSAARITEQEIWSACDGLVAAGVEADRISVGMVHERLGLRGSRSTVNNGLKAWRAQRPTDQASMTLSDSQVAMLVQTVKTIMQQFVAPLEAARAHDAQQFAERERRLLDEVETADEESARLEAALVAEQARSAALSRRVDELDRELAHWEGVATELRRETQFLIDSIGRRGLGFEEMAARLAAALRSCPQGTPESLPPPRAKRLGPSAN